MFTDCIYIKNNFLTLSCLKIDSSTSASGHIHCCQKGNNCKSKPEWQTVEPDLGYIWYILLGCSSDVWYILSTYVPVIKFGIARSSSR